MTDVWADAWACTPIRVTVHGDGPVSDADATPDCRTVCWVCVTPWPCDAYRAGRPNAVQLAHDGGPESTAPVR